MIHILMATYNGGKYLSKQLDSIKRQTVDEWIIHVRDDGSTDNTMDIIGEFAKDNPGKVDIIPPELYDDRHGVKYNFSKLVSYVREKGYYMFCDQDDIWNVDKIEISLRELKLLEQSDGYDNIIPAMVCADATLIDEDDKIINESFLNVSKLYMPEKALRQKLYLYNFAQGSTMMWNSELHKLIEYIPEEAVMHDWWFAIVAAKYGKISYINTPLMQYRQHASNVLGDFDRGHWHRSFISKLKPANIKQLIKNNNDLKQERIRQADVCNKIYKDNVAVRYIDIMNCNNVCAAIVGIKEGYIFLSVLYSVKYYIL